MSERLSPTEWDDAIRARTYVGLALAELAELEKARGSLPWRWRTARRRLRRAFSGMLNQS